MTGNEKRTLEFISQRPIGQDEVNIFHQLGKISFPEMRLFLQNLMRQGLLDGCNRRVENSRLATIWKITAKGKKILMGDYDNDHSAPKEPTCCHN